jgi:MYXO-CTERM domain-containing protein
MQPTLATLSGLALAIAIAPAASADHVTVYTSDLVTLNPGVDGNAASGTATLTVTRPTEMTRTLRVQISATGLPDAPEGATHVAHIHGQFAANEGLPAAQQTSGPFFSGSGGTPVDSTLPGPAQDANGNGYLSFFEGLPSYGPVVLNLSDIQVPPAPDGTGPLIQGINVVMADNGIGLLDAFPNDGTTFELDTTYSFDLSDPDAARQWNNIGDLTKREIVLHGLAVDKEISDALDAAAIELGLPAALLGIDLGNGTEFRTTGPVAAGTIVPTPGAAAAGLLMLGGLIARRRRTA